MKSGKEEEREEAEWREERGGKVSKEVKSQVQRGSWGDMQLAVALLKMSPDRKVRVSTRQLQYKSQVKPTEEEGSTVETGNCVLVV